MTPFLLCHGLADGVVLPEMSGLSVASLLGPTAGPIDSVEHCTYPGLQHAFCASEVGDIGDFLLKRLPRKEAAQLSAKSEGSEGVGNLPANQQAARAKTVVRGNAAVARPRPLCGQGEKELEESGERGGDEAAFVIPSYRIETFPSTSGTTSTSSAGGDTACSCTSIVLSVALLAL